MCRCSHGETSGPAKQPVYHLKWVFYWHLESGCRSQTNVLLTIYAQGEFSPPFSLIYSSTVNGLAADFCITHYFLIIRFWHGHHSAIISRSSCLSETLPRLHGKASVYCGVGQCYFAHHTMQTIIPSMQPQHSPCMCITPLRLSSFCNGPRGSVINPTRRPGISILAKEDKDF